MLYSIKDREYFENLDELVSIQNQVKGVRLQDKLGKQIIHENIKKGFDQLQIQSKIPLKI